MEDGGPSKAVGGDSKNRKKKGEKRRVVGDFYLLCNFTSCPGGNRFNAMNHLCCLWFLCEQKAEFLRLVWKLQILTTLIHHKVLPLGCREQRKEKRVEERHFMSNLGNPPTL